MSLVIKEVEAISMRRTKAVAQREARKISTPQDQYVVGCKVARHQVSPGLSDAGKLFSCRVSIREGKSKPDG